MKNRTRITALAAVMVLSACSSGSVGPPSLTTGNPANAGKLQFAVGTANIYGTTTGLNVVSTFRSAKGLSAVGASTPTIKGPFTLPPASTPGALINPYTGAGDQYSTLMAGPSVEDVAANQIGGTLQSVRPGTPVCDQTSPCSISGSTIQPNTSTFGQSGGVFGMGLQPANSTINTTAQSYVPYPAPLYDTSTNTFYPWGGPPAFDPDKNGMGTRDGLWNLAAPILGIVEGITPFEGVTPSTGAYSLNVAVQVQNASGSATTYNYTANANLGSTALLGTATAPTLSFDGNGGASFTVGAMPAGVTEAFVQIVDWGPGGTPGNYPSPQSGPVNCQGSLGTSAYPVYYTVEVTGAGTYNLPDTDGPNLNASGGGLNLTASPSICTGAQNTAALGSATAGDTVSVQFVGFDYPAYEMSYLNGAHQAPAITGSNGQADITISAPATQASP